MGAYLPTHPGEPMLSLGLSINTNHQVISFHTLSRCKRVQLESPSHTRRQLPFWVDAGLAAASPLPPFLLQFAIPTSFTMGRREQRGVVWGPNGCSLSLEKKTRPTTHPSTLSKRRYLRVLPRQVCVEGASSWTSAPKTPRSTCANIPVQIHIAHFSIILLYLNITQGNNLAVVRYSAVAPK